ncbi:MAG: GNAT family N-acetyltransferase [Inquilinaceae bacterium]
MGGSETPASTMRGQRVSVTLAGPADAADLCAFHRRNKDHLRPWLPPVPDDFLTHGYWERWTYHSTLLIEQDRAIRLVIRPLEAPDGVVLGQINMNNIVRGALQGCDIGYHLDAAAEGHGLMFEALSLVLPYAFGPCNLHRVMANYVPTNARSARLLERLGFQREGYAKDYLFIDGLWRDHVLTALTNPNPRPPAKSTAKSARPAVPRRPVSV